MKYQSRTRRAAARGLTVYRARCLRSVALVRGALPRPPLRPPLPPPPPQPHRRGARPQAWGRPCGGSRAQALAATRPCLGRTFACWCGVLQRRCSQRRVGGVFCSLAASTAERSCYLLGQWSLLLSTRDPHHLGQVRVLATFGQTCCSLLYRLYSTQCNTSNARRSITGPTAPTGNAEPAPSSFAQMNQHSCSSYPIALPSQSLGCSLCT